MMDFALFSPRIALRQEFELPTPIQSVATFLLRAEKLEKHGKLMNQMVDSSFSTCMTGCTSHPCWHSVIHFNRTTQGTLLQRLEHFGKVKTSGYIPKLNALIESSVLKHGSHTHDRRSIPRSNITPEGGCPGKHETHVLHTGRFPITKILSKLADCFETCVSWL